LSFEVLVVLQIETIGKEGDHPCLDIAVELLELVVMLLIEVEVVPNRIEMKDTLLEHTRPGVVNVEDGRGVGSRHFCWCRLIVVGTVV
jgi:hypothetical protein